MTRIDWTSVKNLDVMIKGHYSKSDAIHIYVYVMDRDGKVERIPHKSSIEKWQEDLFEITGMARIKTIVVADRHQHVLLRMEIRPKMTEKVPLHTGETGVVERFAYLSDKEREVWTDMTITSIMHYLKQGE